MIKQTKQSAKILLKANDDLVLLLANLPILLIPYLQIFCCPLLRFRL